MAEKVRTKDFAYEVKDVDTTAGVVEIYVNAFGNVDSDGDISAKGSFSKTIKEGFKRMRHLYNHDKNVVLGCPLELIEDDFGLRVRSAMNMEKQISKDVLSDYLHFKKHDRSLEHSIGYEVVKRDEKNKAVISEYFLWEYSTLSAWGANSETPFLGAKSQKDFDQKFSMLVEMYNSKYSDSRYKQIESALETLAKLKPDFTESTTLVIEPPKDDATQLFKSFREGLKLN